MAWRRSVSRRCERRARCSETHGELLEAYEPAPAQVGILFSPQSYWPECGLALFCTSFVVLSAGLDPASLESFHRLRARLRGRARRGRTQPLRGPRPPLAARAQGRRSVASPRRRTCRLPARQTVRTPRRSARRSRGRGARARRGRAQGVGHTSRPCRLLLPQVIFGKLPSRNFTRSMPCRVGKRSAGRPLCVVSLTRQTVASFC